MSKIVAIAVVAMVSLPAFSIESSKANPGKMNTWKVGDYIEGVGTVANIRKNKDKVEIQMTGENGEKIVVSYDDEKKDSK